MEDEAVKEEKLEMPASDSSGNKIPVVAIVVVLVVIVGGFYWLNRNGSKAQESNLSQVSMVPQEAKVAGGSTVNDSVIVNDVQTSEGAISVEGGSFYFKPNEIR